MSEFAGRSGPAVSRRDAIRRGAVLGGTLVWAAPVVQSLSMSAAHAQGASPPPPGEFEGPSYVLLNVVCDDGKEYFVKFESDPLPGAFENEPGNPPAAGCPSFVRVGEQDDGSGQGMGGVAEGDCITITTGPCTVMASAVKKSQSCVMSPHLDSPTGSGTLRFCS